MRRAGHDTGSRGEHDLAATGRSPAPAGGPRRRRGMYPLLWTFVLLYIVGLFLWTPVYLCWPRRYHGMTFGESLRTKGVLVRYLWANVFSWFRPRRGPG